MPSGFSIEREIEDALIASPASIGYPDALPIRNVKFDERSGRVDVMLLPTKGSKKLVLIEVKRHNATDAPDKVVGQLIKYYAHATKLGSVAINRYRLYAANNPKAAQGHEKTTPQKVFDGKPGSQVWPCLSEGDPIHTEDIDLMIALNGEPSLILHQIISVLAEQHKLPIKLVCVKDGLPRVITCKQR